MYVLEFTDRIRILYVAYNIVLMHVKVAWLFFYKNKYFKIYFSVSHVNIQQTNVNIIFLSRTMNRRWFISVQLFIYSTKISNEKITNEMYMISTSVVKNENL